SRALGIAADGFAAVVPEHVEEPLSPVVIVEEGWVEAGGIDIDGIGPWPFDGRRGDDVVVRVLEVAVVALDVRIDEPEQPVGIGKAWRPYAAGIGIATHVELA